MTTNMFHNVLREMGDVVCVTMDIKHGYKVWKKSL